jgi:ribosomal protein S17E
MNHLVKNEYGFCQDGKVYINAYLNFPQREIGFVRNTEQEALDYFVNRFELAKTKVIQLASEINDVQNKGSYLTKVVQMKAYLAEFDGLGDFQPLFTQLDSLEVFLKDLIQNNQIKNLEIKRALIEDAKVIAGQEDVLQATEDLMELKAKWVKTGPVDKKYQDSLSDDFQEVMDHFFLRRRAYFEEKNRQIDEKILILQGYIDSVHQLRKAEDLDDSIIKVKELQKEWKNVIGLPPKKQSMLWKNFKKANDMFFEKYNRVKGIEYKPRVDPRIQELTTMTGELELKLHDQQNMTATADLAKAYLVKWKEITAQIKSVDRQMAERFRNVCDKIFEMNYLLRVISYRHPALNEKPRIEQLKIMINQMDYMTKKERGELEDFIAQVESDRQMEEKPIISKINTQKRKISMKELLLTGFKVELDALLNA